MSAAPEAMQTILLLDVDGVLNVAVKDTGRGQLNLDANNLAAAQVMLKSDDADDTQLAARLIAASECKLENIGEEKGLTYASFIADDATSVSDALVERFVELIQMAGANRKVVLSSSWRRPEHSKAVKMLEQSISNHLGAPFVFDAMTPLTKERTAKNRIDTIGLFLEAFNKEFTVPAGGQRVLVLDDLFATTLSENDASCSSVANTEHYLRTWMPASDNISVKFVHTFAEWNIINGDRVKVGTGLTMEHFNDAADFLTTPTCTKKTTTSTDHTPVRVSL